MGRKPHLQVAKIDPDLLHHDASSRGPKGAGIAEAIQLVHYKPGQEYMAHHDWSVSVGAPATTLPPGELCSTPRVPTARAPRTRYTHHT